MIYETVDDDDDDDEHRCNGKMNKKKANVDLPLCYATACCCLDPKKKKEMKKRREFSFLYE